MNERKSNWDLLILACAGIASTFGLIALYSQSLAENDANPWKQSILLGLAICIFMVVRLLPAKVCRTLLALTAFASLIGVALTFTSLGVTTNSQTLWLKVPGLGQIQPSEFLKASVVVLVGLLMVERGPRPVVARMPKTNSEIIQKYLLPHLVHLFPVLLGLFAAAAVIAQKDMGTAAVIAVSVIAMYIVGGAPQKVLIGLGVGAAVCAVVFVSLVSYRADRIDNWWNRWESSKRDGGLQQRKSEIGLARGGLLGVGLAQGLAKENMPVGESDLIVTTIGEEVGLVGSLVVLGVLALLVFAIFGNASSPDSSTRVAWVGMGVWIASQTVVNFGMANAALPAIGLPLPFMSQGGSNLWALWFGLAALMALSNPIELGTRRRHATGSNRRRNGGARIPSA